MAVAGSTYKKKNIPKAVREALWIQYYPSKFRAKCQTTWCPNQITAFDFQAGHNIPESKGGATSLENLVPICSRCNSSMGNQYTFIEWCQFHSSKKSFVQKLFSCLTILFSTNLTNWSLIGTQSQVSPGYFEFNDRFATNYPKRFYKLAH